MTTMFAEPPTDLTEEATRRLRTETTAVRLSVSWPGVQKSLTPGQKAEAAEAFGAEGQVLSAGKKLLDIKHPAFKAVTAVRTKAVGYWRAETLPFPEPGLRLIRRDRIDEFQERMQDGIGELEAAVEYLDQHYDELRQAAERRLGRLFNPADYPASLAGAFQISWEFPSVEPPNYLQRLHPALYDQECQRVQARFDEAIRLAEHAFLEELHKLIAHLTERLAGHEDGQPKVFRDSAVDNLTAFFDRFAQLNVGSSAELDQLVGQARQIVQGVPPQSLRDNTRLRQQVTGDLAQVQERLDDFLMDRPRRNILRRSNSPSLETR